MTDQIRPRVKYVIGPDGSPLTIAELPPRNTKRWVIRRKAEVVAAVRVGLLHLEGVRGARRPAQPGGSLRALHADGRGIPLLAAADRAARPRRPAHHAHPAVSR